MNDIGMVKLWPEIEIKKKKIPVNHVQFVFIRERRMAKIVLMGGKRREERRGAEAWKTSLCHCNPGETMMVISGFN